MRTAPPPESSSGFSAARTCFPVKALIMFVVRRPLALGEDHRGGDPAVVAHGQVPAFDALGIGHGQRWALDLDGGPVVVQSDPAVLPVHACRRPQDLGHCFLGGEPPSQRAGVELPFGRNEQAIPQARCPLQLPSKTLDVDYVYAYAYDHAAILRSRSWRGYAAGRRRSP